MIGEYSRLINIFVRENQSILGENPVGVYLHGSAVMGCFNSLRSDLDLSLIHI